ncbi:PREDICTED: protein misato isoform X1 [Rhagoletis zephyria]|uniref:protein misato isoform X1 n=2 Tax=Rhagoletis zephyria TaxID=28612 RepID=UPI0008118E32|nr:PREDICTED: protein misato isoform X1 [Rhagoletis zephyria]
MSSKREVVSLQFGNYANYIGAHWWNIQESSFNYNPDHGPSEINHDVLYREGVNLNKQVTYTPRLLLVDLDGSLKHLPREGELYGNSIKRTPHSDANSEDAVKKIKEDLQNMSTDLEVVQQPQAPKHEFQKDLENPVVNIQEKEYNLTDDVETWTDYLYARYHPRTVNVVNEYKHEAEKQTFDTFASGVQLWKTEKFEDEFCDKIRQYVEECDFLQGFQTLFDCFNGFSGLATECLEHLNDEYGKANFAIPVYSPRNTLFKNAGAAMTDSIRVVNSALTFHKLSEQASLFVPLGTCDRVWRQFGAARQLPALNYQADNLYQTSAVLAAYLDTISLRYRLRNAPGAYSLPAFCGDLNNYGRKLAAAAFALPFAMQHDQYLIDCLDKFEGPIFTSLTPNCSIGTDYIIQSLCVRGIPRERLKRPLEKAKEQMRMAAYKCDSVSEMFQLYLQCANHASMAHVASISMAMPTRIPFPSEIFAEDVTKLGFLSATTKRQTDEKVISVPTLAAVQSSSELGETLETLHREAKRVKIAKLHRYKAAGLEQDEYAEALEQLLLFKDNYEDNFEL